MFEPLLAPFQQWLLFVGVTFAVGSVTWRLVVAPATRHLLEASHAAALADRSRRVARWGLIAAVVILVAWILRGAAQLMAFRDPFVPISEDISFLLFQTFWGTVWMAQGPIALLLALAFWRAGARKPDGEAGIGRLSPAWVAATALALAAVTTLALSSHAMGVERWQAAIVAADGFHALAAGAWIGTLGMILLTGRTHAEAGGRDLFAAQIRVFSPLAMVTVATLILMGVVLSWTHLTTLSDLWTVNYGRILLAKILLAGGVLAAGFVNWRRGVPALSTEAGARVTGRRATLEVVLAAGVLLLTAFLVHSVKP